MSVDIPHRPHIMSVTSQESSGAESPHNSVALRESVEFIENSRYKKLATEVYQLITKHP